MGYALSSFDSTLRSSHNLTRIDYREIKKLSKFHPILSLRIIIWPVELMIIKVTKYF